MVVVQNIAGIIFVIAKTLHGSKFNIANCFILTRLLRSNLEGK